MTHHSGLSAHELDEAIISAMFQLAAELGWNQASPAAAATRAGLDHAKVRARFSGRRDVLLALNMQADRHALDGASFENQDVRTALFDLLMRRVDVLQRHRTGVIALLKHLPFDPCATIILAGLTLRSMRWMLDAAGQATGGIAGNARVAALAALWTNLVRVWQKDGSDDLSVTMAALDKMLGQVEKAAQTLGAGRKNFRPESDLDSTESDPTPKGGTVRSSD